jgi:hypothetical protein
MKMAKKSRVQELTDLLKDLEATTPDIEASAVVSVDGLMIASALPQDVEEDRVAAMSAAMLSLGERTAKELARGDLSEVYVKGQNGYVLLMAAGGNPPTLIFRMHYFNLLLLANTRVQ